MAFITDKQTLDDLGIFGKPGSNSVYSLFNRTCTTGGAAILEEIFTYPLSDAGSINERIWNIQQLAEQKITFPFNPEDVGLAEHYLANTDERTKLSQEQHTAGKRLMNLISTDTEYKLLYKGVTSLKEILNSFWNFLQSGSLGNVRIHGQDGIISLLQEEVFQQLFKQKRNEALTYAMTAEYDTLFRFKKRAGIKQVLQFGYYLDAYIAIAKVGDEKNFCFPKVVPGKSGSSKLAGVYHPLLEKPVANSIEITPEQNIVFLTGANMAGKSTLMKTLGIAVFLAHLGFPVPATSMEFVVMDGLYSTINLPDNLGMGTSHFYAEVLRVKKIAKELGSGKNLFIIIDELFRGTNVKDAYEATIAIISAFSKRSSSVFIISTHIIEAGAVLKETCPNMQFQYLPTRINGNVPVYTYTLEKGITNDRHGMVIIQNEGILEILNAEKKQISDEFHNR